MAEHEISLESIVQHGESEQEKTIILITHETTEAAVREALAAVEKDDYVAGKPQMIRIEK